MSSLSKPSIFYSSSVEETLTIASLLVKSIAGRGVISLEGPLGAGKTHFVKGVARALEIQEEVTSPTFTLLQIYGLENNRLYHFDFYRFNEESEALDLGLEDYFSEYLTLIEWGNKFPSLLPPETIRVIIEPLENGARMITWNS
ncbi:MAG: tRNA (adenosine(37)-N6)-threonylcarbamoyltransferase complex ATPase subunit type 1 TsaE [Chthoniobacterales bacterium]|jgi:tRNA threonylcarbamoyladenosine biosynthesis protein TsaE|nr:tRNA (adenosine(37)-N6)-threonylcarbamoyltransferase complex ATPase subunit type 1 TsaE [Chthoniobacterales bacterium]